MAAAKTALEHILDEVRELIRRRGMDPVADRRAARFLVDEVMNHYEERVATSALPPLLDRAGVPAAGSCDAMLVLTASPRLSPFAVVVIVPPGSIITPGPDDAGGPPHHTISRRT